MTDFTYYSPMDIGSAFRSKVDVGELVEFIIKQVNKLYLENDGVKDFIPPVVYSRQGRVFNVDYNFLVICLSKWLDDPVIRDDFFMAENTSADSMKNGFFLVVGILENYYDVVRVRQKKIDVSKFKTNKPFEVKDKFYNLVVIRNKENVKRFSAIPFSASVLKGMLHENDYALLVEMCDKEEFKQVAFGLPQYGEYVRSSGGEVEHVTSNAFI